MEEIEASSSPNFSRHGFGIEMSYLKKTKTFIIRRGLFRVDAFVSGQHLTRKGKTFDFKEGIFQNGKKVEGSSPYH